MEEKVHIQEGLYYHSNACAIGGSDEKFTPAELTSEYHYSINQLNIGSVYTCNMRCKYCYNEKDYKDLKGSESRGKLADNLSRKAINDLFDNADPTDKTLFLFFAGGEVTIDQKGLLNAIRHARKRESMGPFTVRITVYTNGTLLTDDLMRELTRLRVNLVFSLDGPPAIHDKNRIFHNGDGTSEVILNNIYRYFEQYSPTIRQVRCVVSDPSVRSDKLHEYFFRLGFNNIECQPSFSEISISSSLTNTYFDSLSNWYMDKIRQGIYINVAPFYSVFQKLASEGNVITSHFPCSNGRYAIGLDNAGNYYSCHHYFGETEKIIGRVESGFPGELIMQNLNRDVDSRVCRNCWAKYLCGGECYQRAEVSGKGYFGVDSKWCDIKKHYFHLALKNFVELAAEHRDNLIALLNKGMTIPKCDPKIYKLASFGEQLP